jgi:hypothetical protein
VTGFSRVTSARVLLAAVLGFLLAGCGHPQPIFDRHWPDAYWRHGRLVLLAIDTEAQMNLSYDTDGYGTLGLVGPTVFAVGANRRYVVAKQHPCGDGTHFDRATTNYFIVDCAADTMMGRIKTPKVLGPLSKAEFDRLPLVLALPRFHKTFAALEWQRTED